MWFCFFNAFILKANLTLKLNCSDSIVFVSSAGVQPRCQQQGPPRLLSSCDLKGILTEVKRILSACLVKPPAPHLRMTNNRCFWCCLQTRQRVSNLFHLYKQLVYSCLFFSFFLLPNCGTISWKQTPQVNSTVTICCLWFVPCRLCLKRN